MEHHSFSRRIFLRSSASFLSGALLASACPVLASPARTAGGPQVLPAFIDPCGWSGDAWKTALPVFHRILVHPFITGLADGTLPQDVFAFYVRQDALYLESYARTMSLIAARLPKQEQRDLMTGFIKDTLAVERSMHELYQSMHETHLPPAPAKASPTCQL